MKLRICDCIYDGSKMSISLEEICLNHVNDCIKVNEQTTMVEKGVRRWRGKREQEAFELSQAAIIINSLFRTNDRVFALPWIKRLGFAPRRMRLIFSYQRGVRVRSTDLLVFLPFFPTNTTSPLPNSTFSLLHKRFSKGNIIYLINVIRFLRKE